MFIITNNTIGLLEFSGIIVTHLNFHCSHYYMHFCREWIYENRNRYVNPSLVNSWYKKYNKKPETVN